MSYTVSHFEIRIRDGGMAAHLRQAFRAGETGVLSTSLRLGEGA
jgi:hypothetical protein